MTARSLVIGLDGADVDVVRGLGPARLPVLHALMERGAWARLESVKPPATLPNWCTFLTGVDPGRHGVFDFTTRHGYRVSFTGGTVREAPTIAARLDALGEACAVIGFPATWPPERLAHGVFVSGWDSPVAFEADESFVWPRALGREIRARFGPIRWGDVDEFAAGTPGWYARLGDALVSRVSDRLRVAEWLLGEREWSLFAVYFGESDTAAHHLWAHHDPASPRRPARVSAAEGSGLGRVYEALDRAVGALVAAAGEGVELTIVSDHGSGAAGDRALYLNRALAEAGLAALREGGAMRGAAAVKDLALGVLPAAAKDRLFRLAGRALPGWLESRARFGGLDMARTRVFSEELNYFPSLCVNLRGREPEGVVSVQELPALREEIERFAETLRDPWTGNRVIAAVHARESLYEGPFVDRAPDFVLELALDARGASYNVMPSASAPPGTGAWRRLAPEEHLGRKGRSLPGSHRSHGLMVIAGPRVMASGEIDARIADATATLLARMGVTPPDELSGRVLREALSDEVSGGVSLPDAPAASRGRGDLAETEARLRALGYVD